MWNEFKEYMGSIQPNTPFNTFVFIGVLLFMMVAMALGALLILYVAFFIVTPEIFLWIVLAYPVFSMIYIIWKFFKQRGKV